MICRGKRRNPQASRPDTGPSGPCPAPVLGEGRKQVSHCVTAPLSPLWVGVSTEAPWAASPPTEGVPATRQPLPKEPSRLRATAHAPRSSWKAEPGLLPTPSSTWYLRPLESALEPSPPRLDETGLRDVGGWGGQTRPDSQARGHVADPSCLAVLSGRGPRGHGPPLPTQRQCLTPSPHPEILESSHRVWEAPGSSWTYHPAGLSCLSSRGARRDYGEPLHLCLRPVKTKRYPQDYLRWYRCQPRAALPRTSAWRKRPGFPPGSPASRRTSPGSLKAVEQETDRLSTPGVDVGGASVDPGSRAMRTLLLLCF